MSCKTTKAICFDFDGTLARFTGDFGGLIAGFYSELMPDRDDPRGFSSKSFAEVLSQELHREGPVTLRGAVQATLGVLEHPLPDDSGQLAAQVIADYSEQMALLPGALDILNFCRGRELPLALLTNGPEDMQRAAVRAVGLESYFSRILVSGDPDIAVRKPDSRMFKLACEALSTKPENTLMVGDNLEADVRGALSCGMQAVYLGAESGPGYETVPDIQAFGAWLKTYS